MLDHGYSLILVYLLGGLAGTLYETFLNLKRHNGFRICSGSLVTPFNFVYGFGGVIIFLSFFSLEPYFLTWWCGLVILVSGTFLGGIVEYLLSFLEEKICHTRSWDYTGKIGSINGRTTIPIMIGWGFLCLIVMYGVFYPMMRYLINPYILDDPNKTHIYHVALLCLICLCAIDLVFVLVAILRYSRRAEGKPTIFTNGHFIDVVFSDTFMAIHFPNARKTSLQRGFLSLDDVRVYFDKRKKEVKTLFKTSDK